jgi:hypothetical protein
MSPTKPLATVAAALLLGGSIAGLPREAPGTRPTTAADSVTPAQKQTLIRSALAAAPESVAANAAVVAPGPDGKMMELRSGTNGFTCIPDNPESPGKDPMCLDEQGMQWAKSLMSHQARPASTAPGFAYMLQGGSDVSATDPWAKTTTDFVDSPPHWMLLWPVDAKETGFPTTPKKTGSWIMWAGTPYAHLMVNQVP